jgi:endonuclease/exonuclease/phosphatase family metal-dependent hydrolase
LAAELRVMTQNLYLGADLAPLIRAHTVAELGDVLESTLRALADSDAPGRLAAVAELIKEADPDLVGLQEVAVWERRGKVLADFGDLLQAELGNRYRVAAEWHPSRPPDSPGRRVVEIGNLILVHSGLRVEAHAGEYWGKLSIKHPLAGEIGLPRGWVAVDAKVEGRPFRFVNTHLEATIKGLRGAAEVQVAQAAELEAGPARSKAPVIVVGDLNSDPKAKGVVPTASRQNLVQAGFTDAWAALNPDDEGLTWRLDDDIRDPGAELGARIDVVMTRGAIRPIKIERLGLDPACRTLSGRWPSDHLAVLATLAFDEE